jgi:hypothetical protein
MSKIYTFKQIEDITLKSFTSIIHKEVDLYKRYTLKIFFNYGNSEFRIAIPKDIKIILRDYKGKTCEDIFIFVFSTIHRYHRYNIPDKISITIEITS